MTEFSLSSTNHNISPKMTLGDDLRTDSVSDEEDIKFTDSDCESILEEIDTPRTRNRKQQKHIDGNTSEGLTKASDSDEHPSQNKDAADVADKQQKQTRQPRGLVAGLGDSANLTNYGKQLTNKGNQQENSAPKKVPTLRDKYSNHRDIHRVGGVDASTTTKAVHVAVEKWTPSEHTDLTPKRVSNHNSVSIKQVSVHVENGQSERTNTQSEHPNGHYDSASAKTATTSVQNDSSKRAKRHRETVSLHHDSASTKELTEECKSEHRDTTHQEQISDRDSATDKSVTSSLRKTDSTSGSTTSTSQQPKHGRGSNHAQTKVEGAAPRAPEKCESNNYVDRHEKLVMRHESTLTNSSYRSPNPTSEQTFNGSPNGDGLHNETLDRENFTQLQTVLEFQPDDARKDSVFVKPGSPLIEGDTVTDNEQTEINVHDVTDNMTRLTDHVDGITNKTVRLEEETESRGSGCGVKTKMRKLPQTPTNGPPRIMHHREDIVNGKKAAQLNSDLQPNQNGGFNCELMRDNNGSCDRTDRLSHLTEPTGTTDDGRSRNPGESTDINLLDMRLDLSSLDDPQCDTSQSGERQGSTPSSARSSVRDQGSQTTRLVINDVLGRHPASPRVSPLSLRSSPRLSSAELHRTPDQMVKQADRLIERTQAILERSAEAKKRTEERLKASKERRAQDRLEELTDGGKPLSQIKGLKLSRSLDDLLSNYSNGYHRNDDQGNSCIENGHSFVVVNNSDAMPVT